MIFQQSADGKCRFLRLLINHDWALEHLVVDMNGDMTCADYNTITITSQPSFSQILWIELL